MAKAFYTVRIKQEGKGKASVHQFTDLKQAQLFILEYWQGAEYIDGNQSFHTDYSTFRLVGFNLNDIGTFSYDEGFRDYRFNSEEPAEQEFPEDNGDFQSTFFSLPKKHFLFPINRVDDSKDVPF